MAAAAGGGFWQSAAGRYTRRAMLATPILMAIMDSVADVSVVRGTSMQVRSLPHEPRPLARHALTSCVRPAVVCTTAQPTINGGGSNRDVVLLDKGVVRKYDVRRGDVVAMWCGSAPPAAGGVSRPQKLTLAGTSTLLCLCQGAPRAELGRGAARDRARG